MNNRKRKFDDDDQENDLNHFYVYDSKRRLLKSNLNLTNQSNAKSVDSSLKPIGSNIRLFDMCLTYVATHMECVDSLVGFPDQIGHLLFAECIRQRKFDATQPNASGDVIRCIDLFANSYEFMSSLNLSRKSLQIIDLCGRIIRNSKLDHLDLSGTQFIQSKEFNLFAVLESSESSLIALNLSDCNLDEDFVRALTLRQRIEQANFSNLVYLDLSLNYKLIKHWHDRILNYFSKYPHLNTIVFGVYRDDADDLANKLTPSSSLYKLCKCEVKREEFATKGLISKLDMDLLISNNDKQKSIDGN